MLKKVAVTFVYTLRFLHQSTKADFITLKFLQNLLGHTDIKVTLDTYSDVFENFQNENVAKVDEYLSRVGLVVNV